MALGTLLRVVKRSPSSRPVCLSPPFEADEPLCCTEAKSRGKVYIQEPKEGDDDRMLPRFCASEN